MENYDNLFEQQPEQTEQPFDREAWAQQKREQRQELYNLIEEMSEKTLTDPSALSDYLHMQARLGKASVANTLLMIAQKPNATFISGFDDWQKRGRSVKRGEKAALVLEANGEYERPDGTMGVNFDVKRVFDISQTYGKPIRERTAPPIKTALKAITTNVPVPVKLSEGISQSVGAMYSEKDNTVSTTFLWAITMCRTGSCRRKYALSGIGADCIKPTCGCAVPVFTVNSFSPASYTPTLPT